MVPKETIDKILAMYVDEDCDIEALRTPITQGDYVYATERHILISITKSLVETDYPVQEKIKCYPLFNKEPNCNEKVSSLSLREKIAAATVTVPEMRRGKQVECEECGGTGRVRWKYKEYTLYDDCPKCDGEGYCEGPSVPTGRMVVAPSTLISLGVAHFRQEHLQLLLDTLELLGEEEFTIIRTASGAENIFILNENVAVVLMPCVVDE